MAEPTKAELQAVNIPWHTILCILQAVAKFVLCERSGGTHCAETLAQDIRACLKV